MICDETKSIVREKGQEANRNDFMVNRGRRGVGTRSRGSCRESARHQTLHQNK